MVKNYKYERSNTSTRELANFNSSAPRTLIIPTVIGQTNSLCNYERHILQEEEEEEEGRVTSKLSYAANATHRTMELLVGKIFFSKFLRYFRH